MQQKSNKEIENPTIIWSPNNEGFFQFLSSLLPKNAQGIWKLIALNREGGAYLHKLAGEKILSEEELSKACAAGGDFNAKDAGGKSVWEKLAKRRVTFVLPFHDQSGEIFQTQINVEPSSPYQFGMRLIGKEKNMHRQAIFYGELLGNSQEKKFLILENNTSFQVIAIKDFQENWERIKSDASSTDSKKVTILFPHVSKKNKKITKKEELFSAVQIDIDKIRDGFPVYIREGKTYIGISGTLEDAQVVRYLNNNGLLVELKGKKLEEIYPKLLEAALSRLSETARKQNIRTYLPILKLEFLACPHKELEKTRTYRHISDFFQLAIEKLALESCETDILGAFRECIDRVYLSQRTKINSPEINLFSSRFLPMLFLIASVLQPGNPTALLFPKIDPEKLCGLIPGQFIISDEGDVIVLSELIENARIKVENHEPPPYFLHIGSNGKIRTLSNEELTKIEKLCNAGLLCNYIRGHHSEEVVITTAYEYIEHLIKGLEIGSTKSGIGEGSEDTAGVTAERVVVWFKEMEEQLEKKEALSKLREVKNGMGKNIFQLFDESLIYNQVLTNPCVNFASGIFQQFLNNQQDRLKKIIFNPSIKGCVRVATEKIRSLLANGLTAQFVHLSDSSDLASIDDDMETLFSYAREISGKMEETSSKLEKAPQKMGEIDRKSVDSALNQLMRHPDIIANYPLWEIFYNLKNSLDAIHEQVEHSKAIQNRNFTDSPTIDTKRLLCLVKLLLEKVWRELKKMPALAWKGKIFKCEIPDIDSDPRQLEQQLLAELRSFEFKKYGKQIEANFGPNTPEAPLVEEQWKFMSFFGDRSREEKTGPAYVNEKDLDETTGFKLD